MTMSKEEFRERWNSSDDGGKITWNEVAEVAVEWGISSRPRTCRMEDVLGSVLRAAGCPPMEYEEDEDDDDTEDLLEMVARYGGPIEDFDEETPGGSPIFFQAPPRQRARPAKWEKGTWVTKEGQKLRISEMGDGHLVNALRMLKRKGFVGWKTLCRYLRPNGPSGDMARMAFDREAEEVFSRPYHPVYDDLEDEVKRRGLRP